MAAGMSIIMTFDNRILNHPGANPRFPLDGKCACYRLVRVILFLTVVLIGIPNSQDSPADHRGAAAVPDSGYGVNPYPDATYQAEAALFVAASGAAETAFGAACFSNFVYKELRLNQSTANNLRTDGNLLILAGVMQCFVGIPLFIISEVERSKHDKWEKRHGYLRVGFTGSGIVADF
jgi:hypothetical protein